MLKMSLRHLYKDLRELGIYPDLSKTDDIIPIITGSGIYHLNKYYGRRLELDWKDVELYDVSGKLHNSTGPAKFHIDRDSYIIKDVIKWILSGGGSSMLSRCEWYLHGHLLSIGIPDNMFDNSKPTMRVCNGYIFINNTHVTPMYKTYHIGDSIITFNKRYVTICNTNGDVYGRTKIRVLYNGSICYERYNINGVIKDIHYEDGKVVYNKIR